MKNAIIVANGNISKSLINSITPEKFIVAVDGSYKFLKENNLRCDLVVGDLDSLFLPLQNDVIKNGIEIIRYETDKDFTDTDLAIKEVIKRGFKKITVVGAIGTRVDHTLANILLLEKYTGHGVTIRIIDNNNEIELLENSKKTIEKSDGFKYVSFISLTDFSTLSLTGFKYNLIHKKIKRDDTLCISNKQKDSKAQIKVFSGKILMIRSRD